MGLGKRLGRCYFFYGLYAGVSMFAHFPHTFTNFVYFTVSAASTSLFHTGGHFPAVGDRLRQAPLAENGPGGTFSAGDTYLRDRLPQIW